MQSTCSLTTHKIQETVFFHGVLNKSSCLNYLLPDQRSVAITDKLRHASIFKLPHVRTRFKTSFVNYAIDHYLRFTVVL